MSILSKFLANKVCVGAVCVLAAMGINPVQASGFLSVAPDFPIMEGLVENDTEAMAFDKPEGRIVHADLAGKISIADVSDFYRNTLPQLGWSEIDKEQQDKMRLSFERESERLDILMVLHEERPLLVSIAIAPF